ncbi:uncharacterized protein LOC141712863 [Apium graveolens]|uniref:uncharacterized protein LOC141712863 n=1 Tax=Apium graveolens TaxID=4045 RepID=UPI003D7B267D
MGCLDDDDLDDLSRKKLISKIDANFDNDHAMYLTTVLGRSTRTSTTSSSRDDGGDSSYSIDDGDDDSVSDTSGTSIDDGDGDEEDEGQEDTHLKLFLESIKADGNSYVLKRNGKPDLKFEGLDEDADGSCGFDNIEANVVDRGEVSSDCESERRKGGGNDLDKRRGGTKGKGVLREDGMGNSSVVKQNGNVDRRAKGVGNEEKKNNFVDKGKGILVEEGHAMVGKRGGKTVKNVESGKDRLVGNMEFRLFKRRERDDKNLEKKQSYVDNKNYRSVEQLDLMKVKRRGKNVEKKSVVENESDISVEEAEIRLDGTRFLRNAKENGKLERKVKNVQNVKKRKMEYERNNSVEDAGLRPDDRRSPWPVKENKELKRRAKDVNVKKVESCKENERDGSIGELGLKLEKLGKVSCKRKRCHIDPDYKMFFTHSKIEEGKLVLDFNGVRVEYGEDDNNSLTDSEVDVLEHAPDCIVSNYAPTLNYSMHMEEDDLQCLGSYSAAENPEFRKAVIDVLRKPYNKKEYERLRDDVKLRKPTERHVDMRSGNTSFQQTTMGKSYLDHYADLKKQFDAFKYDKPRRLNILRGFFFYLKRMADDGKFKPWLDDSCLAIIPRSS